MTKRDEAIDQAYSRALMFGRTRRVHEFARFLANFAQAPSPTLGECAYALEVADRCARANVDWADRDLACHLALAPWSNDRSLADTSAALNEVHGFDALS